MRGLGELEGDDRFAPLGQANDRRGELYGDGAFGRRTGAAVRFDGVEVADPFAGRETQRPAPRLRQRQAVVRRATRLKVGPPEQLAERHLDPAPVARIVDEAVGVALGAVAREFRVAIVEQVELHGAATPVPSVPEADALEAREVPGYPALGGGVGEGVREAAPGVDVVQNAEYGGRASLVRKRQLASRLDLLDRQLQRRGAVLPGDETDAVACRVAARRRPVGEVVQLQAGVVLRPGGAAERDQRHGQRGQDADDQAWGYGRAPEDVSAFHQRLDGLVGAVLPGTRVRGYCYTQLTDVEQEINGLFRADRTPKFDLDRLCKTFTQEPTTP